MKTLTVDLGTKTGWSVWENETLVASGTLLLATDKELQEARKDGRERSRDLRVDRLVAGLKILCEAPDAVIFEDVQFASTTMQAHLWASLRAALWLAFPNAAFHCVPVATLKAFATGHGKAQKEDMLGVLEDVSEALELQVNFLDADDNEIDAIWLGLFNVAVRDGVESFGSVYQRKQQEKKEKRDRAKAKKLKALTTQQAG